MRDLIVTTFLTLDGVMQAPGGPGEDDSGGFAHGGWLANSWDDQLGELKAEEFNVPFDLLLGRRTYEIWVPYWPNHKGRVSPAISGSTSYRTPATLTLASPATWGVSGSRAKAQNRSQLHISRRPSGGRCWTQSYIREWDAERCGLSL